MGVQDVAETVLLVPRKGYWRIAGRGRGTVTRQLRGGVRCGCSWPRSRSSWTPARRGRRPRLAHPVGLRPMWQGSTRKWDLGEKRTFGAKSTMQTGRFRGASDSSGEHFFERAHSGKSEAPDARWGHLRGPVRRGVEVVVVQPLSLSPRPRLSAWAQPRIGPPDVEGGRGRSSGR